MRNSADDGDRICARALTAGYASRHDGEHVLKSVDLRVREREAVAIMGSSGSGKSTLLNCLATLHTPISGSIMLDDRELTGLPRKQLDAIRRESFGFIYQEYNLIDALTSIQNVQLPTYFARKHISKEKAVAALEAVNLGKQLYKKPGELSGGQRQRVAIARALAVPRRVVFADEPTGALDRENSQLVMEHLLALRSHGTSIVLVTHDPIVAARADRVMFLQDGEVKSVTTGGDPFAISNHLTQMETSA